MFTFRNVVSEVTVGFLGSAYDVGSWKPSPGARSGANVREREMWGVFRADAQAHCGCSRVCLDAWMKAVAMDEVPVGGKD